MACSDNVVRAGLTPKFKDSLTLINVYLFISNSDFADAKLLIKFT